MPSGEDLTLDSISGIRLYQSRQGYRFSIDSVLLAHFTRIPRRVRLVADIGAGSGVIGLLLAKKAPWVKVHLIELQDNLYRLAEMNIHLNGMQNRVKAILMDVRSVPGEIHNTYDLLVCNPPFRPVGTGLISPYEEKAIARHEIALSLPELLESANLILKERGIVSMIYDSRRLVELVYQLRQKRIEPKRLRTVHPYADSRATMVLLEAVKGAGVELSVEPPLIVYSAEGEYSEEVEGYLR